MARIAITIMIITVTSMATVTDTIITDITTTDTEREKLDARSKELITVQDSQIEIVEKFEAGEALVFEPGEDHHLISKGSLPLVFVWMHCEPVG